MYALSSVSLIGVLSFAVVSAIRVNARTLYWITFGLVGLATGAMLGNAIVHLVPESFEFVIDKQISSLAVSLLMLSGFLVSFFLEKGLNFHCHHGNVTRQSQGCEDGHCRKEEGNRHEDDDHHDDGEKHIHPVGHMTLAAHMLDNFNDGVLIGVTYLISIPAGIATTVAIISHEFPLEFGSFGVMINAGFTRWQAIAINVISAFVAFIGTLLVLYFGTIFSWLPKYLTPLGAGIVLYIVAAQLVPMLQKENDKKRNLLQIAIVLFGVAAMVAAKMFEISMGG
jgi:zinc and cadmium transporter